MQSINGYRHGLIKTAHWAILIFFLVPALFCAETLTCGRSARADTFELTREEKAWLQEHSEIRIGIMNAWPPINFVDEQGNPQGIGVDYIRALNKRLNGSLTLVPLPFKESYDLVKAKKLDALMDITPKKEREAFFNFTRPYLNIPRVLVGRKDGPAFETEKELAGRTVALEHGVYNVKHFQQNYPDVIVKEYDSTSKALGAVSIGKADAYAGNRAMAIFIVGRELLANLAIRGGMEKKPSVLAIGTRKDQPILARILDRALGDISLEEINAIHRRWVGEYATTENKPELTPTERAWLAGHPVIRVHNEKDRAPFNFNVKGISRARTIFTGQINTFGTLGILAFTMPIAPCFSPHEVKPPTGEPDAGDLHVRFGGGRARATGFSHPYSAPIGTYLDAGSCPA